jgi:hypothetical protein
VVRGAGRRAGGKRSIDRSQEASLDVVRGALAMGPMPCQDR